jgi:NTE family protein
MKKLGLALSGGGARGIAHLGVLQAFDEFGIAISAISGTSAGAIGGALYANGYKPAEILEIIISTNFFKLIRPAISKTGILKMSPASSIYRKYLAHNSFEQLKIPFYAAATHLGRGETVIFREGDLIRAIMASSCIPVIFDPVKIDGEYYIDGGVLNNMPAEPLTGSCDIIIGVNCNKVADNYKPGNVRDLLERTLLVAINFNAYERQKLCHFMIEPSECYRYSAFDVQSARTIYRIGYEEAVSLLKNDEKLRSLLQLGS